jgi:hypothetical protein
MEALTRLVSESFARHGFDRPLDYRRLHWSRWFPCESPRSLLLVPSKPGVFALAEEIVSLGTATLASPERAERVERGCPAERSSAVTPHREGQDLPGTNQEGHGFSRVTAPAKTLPALAAEGITDGNHRAAARRMLAVLQFCEDDDMAFVLDRMFARENPMRPRLASGRCFVRFVVLEDQPQRRSICNALNQWLLSASEATTGIGPHFATSLEITEPGETHDDRVGRTLMSAKASHSAESQLDLKTDTLAAEQPPATLHSGADANTHCPSPFPSGF